METQVVVAPRSLNQEYLKRTNDGEGFELNNDKIKVYVSYRYSGGVPVNLESVKGSVTCDVNSEVGTQRHRLYGEIKVRHFRTIEDALERALKMLLSDV